MALRLLLDYGLRKGALQAVRFKHFDHQRRRLTIFTKGQKVRELPIPHPPFWLDLERHILEVEAKPDHYLMPRMKGNGAKTTSNPTKPMGIYGMHSWWYRRFARFPIAARDVLGMSHKCSYMYEYAQICPRMSYHVAIGKGWVVAVRCLSC